MKLNLLKTLLVLLLLPVLNTLHAQTAIRVEPAIEGQVKTPKVVPITDRTKRVLQITGSLQPSQKIELDSIAEYLNRNPKSKLQISGHWDNSCADEEAEKKSNEISSIVVNYLTKKGISRRRLLDVGLGSRQPMKDNRTAAGRKANRRVEIQIIP